MPSCSPPSPIRRTRAVSIWSLILADTRVSTGGFLLGLNRASFLSRCTTNATAFGEDELDGTRSVR
jgi:hypothetical protein